MAKPIFFKSPNAARWRDHIQQRMAIDPATGCWHWTVTVGPQGYARAKCGGILMVAHRASWLAFVGPIPEGLQVDHQCHNLDMECLGGPTCPHRRCVNPEHLRLVTPTENAAQRRNRPYGLRGCRKHGKSAGHPREVRGEVRWRCLVCQREQYAANRPEPKPRRTTCSKGHEYTDENTLIGKQGERICRKCARERIRAWKAKKRSAAAA